VKREAVKSEKRNRAADQQSSRAAECSRRSESLRIFATIKVAATKTMHTPYLWSSRAAEQQSSRAVEQQSSRAVEQ